MAADTTPSAQSLAERLRELAAAVETPPAEEAPPVATGRLSRADASLAIAQSVVIVAKEVGEALGDRIRGPKPLDLNQPVAGTITCGKCRESLSVLRDVMTALQEHLEQDAAHDPWPTGLVVALRDLDQGVRQVAAGLRHLHAMGWRGEGPAASAQQSEAEAEVVPG